MIQKDRLRSLIGSALLTAGVIYLGFLVDRTAFWSLFLAFAVAFSGYGLLVIRPLRGGWLRGMCLLGVGLRVALVFAFPLLSDDLYRFLWDGYLINAGENPFARLPVWYLEAGPAVPGLTQELFGRLNSPEYHTVYPPVAQGVFTAATWLSPGSWYGAAVVIKLFLLAGELGSLWLLWRLLAGPPVRGKLKERGANAGRKTYRPDRSNLLFYWLNPLIIVEITGNLHFEGAMVLFLLLAYYLLQHSRWVAAAIAFAASVASKLLPLMLLPFLIRRLWRGRDMVAARPENPHRVQRRQAAANGAAVLGSEESKSRKIRRSIDLEKTSSGRKDWWSAGRPFRIFSLALGLATGLFFLPFLLSADFVAGFRSSLELYQQKFEFNASLYYLAREVGYRQVGWNKIATFGPWLAKASAVGILLVALLDRRSDWASLPAGWLWAFVLYLLCATTVHPWYLSVPIVLCVFTRWRFPLVWSFVIMLTYTNYLTVPYAENLWLVAGEYLLVVGFLIWEASSGSRSVPDEVGTLR